MKKQASAIKVSTRSSDWGKEALNKFYADFPMLINIPAKVSFREKDEAKGFGIGAINIGEYSLPIIIRDFQLFPFDVALGADKVVPFTEETIQLFLSNKGAFSQLANGDQANAFVRFFDNSRGPEYGYAMEKGSEWDILNQIEQNGLCDSQSKEKFAQAIIDNIDLVPKIQKNPIMCKALNKIAQMEEIDGNLTKEAFIAQGNSPIHYIYQEYNGTYTKLSGDANFEDYGVQTDFEEFEIRHLPRILDTSLEKIALFEPKYNNSNGVIYRLANDEHLFVDDSANYRVLVGQDYEVVKKAAYQNGNLNSLVKLAEIPSPGDSGFMFDPKTAQIKTTIIEMDKVAFLDRGLTRLCGSFIKDGQLCKFATLRGLDEPKYSKNEEILYFPESWSFAKLANELPMHKLSQTWDNRIHNVEIVKCIGEDHYDFRGPILSKYAERRDLYDVNRHKVAFSVLQCGGSVEDVEKIANLRPGEAHIVRSPLKLPYSADEIVFEGTKIAHELAGNGEPMFDFSEIMKIAVDMGSTRGVDAVLGTAFLKKDTLNKFVNMLPLFEEALSTLAKLLIYTRMGTDGLNEYEIRRAMEHLSKVVYELHGVKNLEKVK